MHRIVRTFERISQFFNKVSIWITGILVVVMVFMAFAGVIAREAGHSLSWNEEAESYIFIWITCLGAAVTYRAMGHPAVSTLVDRLPAKARAVMRLVADVGVIAFAVVFTWYGIQMSGLEMNETASSFNMPMVYPYLGLPIGGILIIIHALYFAVQDVSAVTDADVARTIEHDRFNFAGGE